MIKPMDVITPKSPADIKQELVEPCDKWAYVNLGGNMILNYTRDLGIKFIYMGIKQKSKSHTKYLLKPLQIDMNELNKNKELVTFYEDDIDYYFEVVKD